MSKILNTVILGYIFLGVSLYSLDENELSKNSDSRYENLYIDSYDEYRKIKVESKSITYYITIESDKENKIIDTFSNFSNTVGNNHIGIRLNPTLDKKLFDSYIKMKEQSKCNKNYFKTKDLNYIIYEDKLNGSCFSFPVEDVKSVINIMTTITDTIHNGDINALKTAEVRENLRVELSKYEFLKKHRDIFETLLEYIFSKL